MIQPTPDREALAAPDLRKVLANVCRAFDLYWEEGVGDFTHLETMVHFAKAELFKADQWLARSSGGGEAVAWRLDFPDEPGAWFYESLSTANREEIDKRGGRLVPLYEALPPPAPSGGVSDAEIEAAFRGYGMALRGEDDAPIPGEPLMSMADAKRITRELIKAASSGVGETELQKAASKAGWTAAAEPISPRPWMGLNVAAPAPLPSGVVELKEAAEAVLVTPGNSVKLARLRAAIAAVPMGGRHGG